MQMKILPYSFFFKKKCKALALDKKQATRTRAHQLNMSWYCIHMLRIYESVLSLNTKKKQKEP